MAPFPTPVNHTVTAIYAAYEAERAERGKWEGLGISISALGAECDRVLYYDFRWISKQEHVDGLKAITFETGELEEERLLNNLEMIGCEVQRVDPETGKQFRYSAVNGHLRGKSDGKALGLPEAPKTWHKVECKSAKNAYFNPIVKKGVKEGYYAHYVQATTYGFLGGLDRVLYMVRNKDTGAIHTERLEVIAEESLRLLAKAERIVYSEEPPPKLHTNPKAKAAYACGYCRHRGVCHDRHWPRMTCRTCIHGAPAREGDARWTCARWSKPLSPDEQRAACPAHLYLPTLIPGEVLEVNEEAETIRYRLADGSEWTDGASPNPSTEPGA